MVVGRNSARGADQLSVNLRVNRSFSLGGLLEPSGGPITIGAPALPAAQRGQIAGGGGVLGAAK